MQYKIGGKKTPQIIELSDVKEEIEHSKVTLAKQWGGDYDKALKATLRGTFEVWSHGNMELETKDIEKAVGLYNALDPREKK